VNGVPVEGDVVLHLHRVRRDPYVDPQVVQRRHERVVEVGDGTGQERNRPGAAVAEPDVEAVVDEIEVDLENSAAERDRRGREPARGDGEADLPPVVQEGDELELDLAHDLGPHVQGVEGVLPLVIRQEWPDRLRRLSRGR
jgi:hypothetical protein